MGGGDDMATTDAQSDITFLDSSDDSDFECWTTEEAAKHNKYQQRKLRYIADIKKLVTEDNKPVNIAFVGPEGVGKSSLINSIAAAFSDERWREHAYSGYFGGEGKRMTEFVKSFPKCCQESKYPDHSLPTLIDIAGFPDEHTQRDEELLRIIFYGRLLEGEALKGAMEYHDKYGMEGLKQKYSTHAEKLRVDRVVFVGSATSDVPTKLIQCVMKAARPTGSVEDKNERTIPVFGVLTKCDKVNFKEEEVKKREEAFIHALGLGGAKHRYARLANYCDDTDPKALRTDRLLPQLDVPVLRFMKQVADPVFKVGQDDKYREKEKAALAPPVVTLGPNLPGAQPGHAPAPGARPWVPPQDNPTALLTTIAVIAIEAVVVALLLQFFLQLPFSGGDLSSACAAYASRGQNSIPGLDNICASKMELLSRSSLPLVPCLCFVIVRAGTIFLLRYLPAFIHQ